MGIVKQKKERIMSNKNYEESMRSLCTNLFFYGSNIRTILFTSTLQKEGKSTIASHLATFLAQMGKKTILVDTDIWNSLLLTQYDTEQEIIGLSQYLSGNNLLKDIIYDTEDEKMSVIFADSNSGDTIKLWTEDLYQKMFDTLESKYDYVLVDTLSMENPMYAGMLAKYCDGAVMIIESGAVSYRKAQKVKSQLEKAGVQILGVVLNKMNIQ